MCRSNMEPHRFALFLHTPNIIQVFFILKQLTLRNVQFVVKKYKPKIKKGYSLKDKRIIHYVPSLITCL